MPNESNRMQTPSDTDRFLLQLVHDMRAPLRQGALNAQLLQRSSASTISSESASHLKAVLQAHRLLDHFLSRVAEYCSAAADPAAAPLASVGMLVQNAIRRAEVDAEAEIVVEDIPDILVPSPVQKVFFELIANALKFRRGPVSIQIVSRCEDSEYRFEVRDNGIGFESRFAEHIWEPMQRLNGIGVFPGFGFGLAISRRIIAGIDGRTWATSKADEGSSFFFSIPAS